MENEPTIITGNALLIAFKGGAERVIQQKQHLNSINVFPVADGDTGNNLASLMSSLLEETSQQVDSGKNVFVKMADAALMGARGNSGIIFAQYLNGLARHLNSSDTELSADNFANSATAAVEDAYQAIEKPVEGTMITVIREWASGLMEGRKHLLEFEGMLTQSLGAAKKALEDTPKQLKILQKKSVVDAGAKGFVLFVEGFTEAFCNSGVTQENQEKSEAQYVVEVEQQVVHLTEEITIAPVFRYCTEVLLTETERSSQELKVLLSELGDSLVVASGLTKTRVHMHTNQPAEMIKRLNLVGNVQQQKADDMLLQYQLKQGPKHSIVLVTDSIADLPAEFILEHQIQVFPMNLLLDSISYLDKLTLTAADFYQLNQQAKERPTSAQPNIKQVETLFAFLENYYQKIIVVTVASKLSGTYNTIKTVADKVQQRGIQIAVIDSKKNSAAEGLMVMEAAEWIAEGLDFSTIVTKIKAATKTTEILVSVGNLKAMIRSGRLPGGVGRFADSLNLKPIVGLDREGGGTITGIAFNTQANERKLMKQVRKLTKKGRRIKRYALIHANDLQRSQTLAEKFTKEIGFPPAYMMEISTVVAMSAGEGCVAIAVSLSEEEE
ncbi:DegV family protein [Carnobacterium gallinarum]|uniref:DegV family protein n=1 Tax=Carnobacterium gallinarum TaxID=2749 RepID=UPI00068A5F28|nr:DegV family protein [Carnobacterium gallinarum]